MLKSLTPEQKKFAAAELKRWFDDERDEPIGDLGVELLLDLIAERIAPFYFNQGVQAARRKVEDGAARLAEDLDVTELPERT
ncbi:hypothetical protein ABI59_20255 [Acidobacteria bacterium Mor1]|nr:hypothetical protein ABI59_20255 [Acidobacteria bacterium Mor1]